MNADLMNRREAIARLSLLLGGALIGGNAYLSGAPVEGKTLAGDFSAADLALMDEVGETIIPTTNTPGAKSVGIGAFMAMMVRDCYTDDNHAVFKAGLGQIEAAAKKKFGTSFMQCSPAQRTELLSELDREQQRHHAHKPIGEPEHYFRMLKQLTVVGFFTSEVGANKVLRYVEVPGGYDGAVPYKKGDRAWFTPPGMRTL
ncbi:MAG TPA: gluconate 2-dehydrogenase subunit 3 family protein [Candidatus Didemnitutus sp.]|nr:gluconate 2-dehydrogenase subunit 3 family protein [Candidatus Didemnitutus sp.]